MRCGYEVAKMSKIGVYVRVPNHTPRTARYSDGSLLTVAIELYSPWRQLRSHRCCAAQTCPLRAAPHERDEYSRVL